MAFCRTEQFEVSPPISGLTPWGHNKKKEQMQTRCLTLMKNDDDDDETPSDDDDDDDGNGNGISRRSRVMIRQAQH